MATVKCAACRKRESESVDEPGIAALCGACWDRVGQSIAPGKRVVCISDETCCGFVDRLEDGDTIAVVTTFDGQDAWIPVLELVAKI